MNAMPPPGSTVAIYCRYSTKHQDYRSIEGQISLCKAYAERHGWVVVGVYYDAERSGTTLVGRTGFFEMMAAAEREEFQVYLTEDIDRASRDAADTHALAKTLKELDIVLCTVSGGVVSDLEVAFKAVQNAEYVKQNTEKTKRGQRQTVVSGRVSGSVTYGHRKVHKIDERGRPINGLRELDPERVEIVRRIFRDYDAGVSTLDICKALNADGVPSPRGVHWTSGVLTGSSGASLGILRNKFYIGEFHWGRTRRKRKQGKIKVRATLQSERLINRHPELAIIDGDMFERVQARLERGGVGPFQSQRRADYLFSGRYVCGECGQPYVVMNRRLGCTGKTLKGICNNSRRVPREQVEDAVLERVKAHLLLPELLEPCLEAYRAEAERAFAEHSVNADQGRRRLKDVEQRINNLVGQLGDPKESPFAKKVVMEEIDRLESERQRLEREAKREPRPVGPALDAVSVVNALKTKLNQFRTSLELDDREAARARESLRDLVEEIVISPAPGTAVDGRGAGPVMITVRGRLAELLALSDIPINRNIQHEPRTETLLDSSIIGFKFSFALDYRDPRRRQVFADLPVLAHVLDHADAPATSAMLLDALAENGRLIEGSDRTPDDRLRYALEFLSTTGQARAVRIGPSKSGWVWNSIGLSDASWKARANDPPLAKRTPAIRLGAPTAVVVVIGDTKSL
jgi:DNA invertase Pin-like site-specific DNA recombinase